MCRGERGHPEVGSDALGDAPETIGDMPKITLSCERQEAEQRYQRAQPFSAGASAQRERCAGIPVGGDERAACLGIPTGTWDSATVMF